jgi:hypothetical protein
MKKLLVTGITRDLKLTFEEIVKSWSDKHKPVVL